MFSSRLAHRMRFYSTSWFIKAGNCNSSWLTVDALIWLFIFYSSESSFPLRSMFRSRRLFAVVISWARLKWIDGSSFSDGVLCECRQVNLAGEDEMEKYCRIWKPYLLWYPYHKITFHDSEHSHQWHYLFMHRLLAVSHEIVSLLSIPTFKKSL